MSTPEISCLTIDVVDVLLQLSNSVGRSWARTKRYDSGWLDGAGVLVDIAGLILGLCPANERSRYKVTPSLIDRRKPRINPVIIGRGSVHSSLWFTASLWSEWYPWATRMCHSRLCHSRLYSGSLCWLTIFCSFWLQAFHFTHLIFGVVPTKTNDGHAMNDKSILTHNSTLCHNPSLTTLYNDICYVVWRHGRIINGAPCTTAP